MKGKTLAKSIALVFISAITACSSGGNSFSLERAPAITDNTPENNDTGGASAATTAATLAAADAANASIPPAPPPVTAASVSGSSSVARSAPSSSSSGTSASSTPAATVSDAPAVTASSPVVTASVPAVPVVASPPVPPKPPKVNLLFVQAGAESGRGGKIDEPDALVEKPGSVIFGLGSDLMRLDASDKRDTRLSSLTDYDGSVFINSEDIDANKIQTLEVMDKGKKVAEFRMVKQTDSVYTTFLPEVTRLKPGTDEADSYAPLTSYIAKPTSDSEFTALTGTVKYSGKVIGYKYGFVAGDHHSFNRTDSKAKTKPTAAEAKINLNVDFDSKKITGKVTERFDSMTGRRIALSEADDDRITAEGITLNSAEMVLKGDITKKGDIWGFHGPEAGGTGGVYVMRKGKEYRTANWGGIFAGTNASEIVGVMELGEEKMSFGATKSKD